MNTEATAITRRAFANGARTAAEVATISRRQGYGKITKAAAQTAIETLVAEGVFENNRYGLPVPVVNLDGERF
jgi:hypothetical protein